MKNIQNIFLVVMLATLIQCGKQPDSSKENQLGQSYSFRIQISLSVHSVNFSSEFYQKIGLEKIAGREVGNNPWVLLTDGHIQYMLSQNAFYSPSITYFSRELEDRFRILEESGLKIHKIQNETHRAVSGILTDPNNFGVTLIQMELNNLPVLSSYKNQNNLRFQEILIPTNNIDSTMEFWQKLGFRSVDNPSQPAHAILVSDGLIKIKILQEKEINPAILIFQTANLSNLFDNIKSSGFQNIEELTDQGTHQTGINLKSPDGQIIYIFQSI